METRVPFPPQDPHPFTRPGIEWLKEGQKGCYGLYQQQAQARAWIYVGRALDIRKRLLEHLNGDDTCITQYWPTHFVAALSDNYETLEKQLIREYNPHCNEKVG